MNIVHDRTAHTLIASLRDVEEAQGLARLLVPRMRVPEPLGRAVELAAVVSYCRPFHFNHYTGWEDRWRIEDDGWPAYTDPNFTALHEHLKSLRSSNYAHSDMAIRRAMFWSDNGRNRGTVAFRRLTEHDLLAFADMLDDLVPRLRHAVAARLDMHPPFERVVEIAVGQDEPPDHPWRTAYITGGSQPT